RKDLRSLTNVSGVSVPTKGVDDLIVYCPIISVVRIWFCVLARTAAAARDSHRGGCRRRGKRRRALVDLRHVAAQDEDVPVLLAHQSPVPLVEKSPLESEISELRGGVALIRYDARRGMILLDGLLDAPDGLLDALDGLREAPEGVDDIGYGCDGLF